MEISPGSEKLLNIIVKLTSFCDLACDYCYVRSHQSKIGSKVLSLSIIEKTICDYLTLAEKQLGAGTDSYTIKFTWHGGEPLLAGLPFFRELVNLQKSMVSPPYHVANSLMTNGAGLNKQWIDFFLEEGFRIGVSLDGPKSVHDAHRKRKDGSGSFDEVMRGIALLQEASVPFGIMSVITSESSSKAAEMFRFFLDHNLKKLNFIPYTSPHDWVSPKEYSTFYKTFFDLWYKLDDPGFYVRDFVNIIYRIFGRESALCEYTHCFGNHMGLDTNGDLYMCDLFIGQSEFKVGNITEMTLGEAMESSKYESLRMRAGTPAAACVKCPLFQICTGGCMYRRCLGKGNLPGKDIYCSSRAELIKHIVSELEHSMKVES